MIELAIIITVFTVVAIAATTEYNDARQQGDKNPCYEEEEL